jgi:hypothetical protein
MTNRNRRWTAAAMLAFAALAVPRGTSAQGEGPGGSLAWSIAGAETLAPGSRALDVQTGWPSTTFGYTFGLSHTSDVSLRLGLLYGYEGTSHGQFGLSFYAPLRFRVAQTRDFRVLFHVDPGIKLYTTSSAQFGFQFPVGVVMGFPVRPDLEVGVGLDFNMSLIVTGARSPQFLFGPQVGPYVEYHLNPHLAVGLNTRFGAAIDAYSSYEGRAGGTSTDFAFVTQLFLGYRLP